VVVVVILAKSSLVVVSQRSQLLFFFSFFPVIHHRFLVAVVAFLAMLLQWDYWKVEDIETIEIHIWKGRVTTTASVVAGAVGLLGLIDDLSSTKVEHTSAFRLRLRVPGSFQQGQHPL